MTLLFSIYFLLNGFTAGMYFNEEYYQKNKGITPIDAWELYIITVILCVFGSLIVAGILLWDRLKIKQ